MVSENLREFKDAEEKRVCKNRECISIETVFSENNSETLKQIIEKMVLEKALSETRNLI